MRSTPPPHFGRPRLIDRISRGQGRTLRSLGSSLDRANRIAVGEASEAQASIDAVASPERRNGLRFLPAVSDIHASTKTTARSERRRSPGVGATAGKNACDSARVPSVIFSGCLFVMGRRRRRSSDAGRVG